MPTASEAFAALRRSGLLVNDPDVVKMIDIDRPDFIEHARKTKPALFAFDARTAAPEDVAARLRDIDRDARRRGFHRQCDTLLANMRAGR